MHTKELRIFTQMTQLAVEQGLEYKILHSYHQRNASNGLTEVYKLILCTNLFTVTYEENLSPENTNAIKGFLAHRNDACVEIPFDVRFNASDIELKSFRN